MIKKRLFVVVLIVLFIVGCQGGGTTSQYVEEDYHKGTQGVVISFLPNAPPSRVYEDDSLDISIQLENKGAYPEGNNFYTLIGKVNMLP